MYLVLKMIFNFGRKQTRTHSRDFSRQSLQPGVSQAPGSDIIGAPVAFGPVYAALSDMEVGGRGVLAEFNLPENVAEQLMNLGFVPGLEVTVAQSGPGGDPRVYRVDGAEVALRGELAKLIAVAPALQTSAESAHDAVTSTDRRIPQAVIRLGQEASAD